MLFRSKKSLNEEQNVYREAILHASELLSEVIGDILDFSQLQYSGIALEAHDFVLEDEIENIVRRSKKNAIKRALATGSEGIRLDDLLSSIRQEYKEHEDLPNTTNPDDWAKISGKKGERIVFIRTLVGDDDADATGGRAIERVQTGQYL